MAKHVLTVGVIRRDTDLGLQDLYQKAETSGGQIIGIRQILPSWITSEDLRRRVRSRAILSIGNELDRHV